jgi:hypothetical protein
MRHLAARNSGRLEENIPAGIRCLTRGVVYLVHLHLIT